MLWVGNYLRNRSQAVPGPKTAVPLDWVLLQPGLVLWLLLFGAGMAIGADWPQWGGAAERNMRSPETGLATSFLPGKKRPDGTGVDLATTENVAWVAKLGSQTFSSPTVAAGRVYIGTNDDNLDEGKYRSSGGGLLLALDARTGEMLWRLVCPRLTAIHKSGSFDEMGLGICGSATVDDNRVYLVTNRCEVVCLDVEGMRNGNDGPFTDEAQYTAGPGFFPITSDTTDADIVWLYDVIGRHLVWPHDASNCSPLVHGDYVYVCTGNGISDKERRPAPQAPSLIVLDKRSGRLVAYDDENIGQRVFHGQWSSPSLGMVGGRPLILFGGGDGVCYAFEPVAGPGDRPVPLKKAWQFQCNPPERTTRNGRPIQYWDGDARNNRGNENDGTYIGPNEIIATPVCCDGRVYLALGQDPLHGRGRGLLWCIDAAQKGDISQTGALWRYERLDRSMSTASVAGARVYVADRPGVIHCLDAQTGQAQWTYDTKAEIWASTLLADGKLYVGTRKDLQVLAVGQTPQLLAKIRLGSPVWATPAAANGMLYVASQGYLWAVGLPRP